MKGIRKKIPPEKIPPEKIPQEKIPLNAVEREPVPNTIFIIEKTRYREVINENN